MERESRCGLYRAKKRDARRPSHQAEGFLTELTQIEPEKVRAYLATSYRLGHTTADIVMKIGERSGPVAELLNSRGHACGAFITAYNPRGTIQGQEDNDRAHAALTEAIRALKLEAIEGSGSEDGSDWPPETSYFIFSIDRPAARALGTQFGQDAIVWVGPGAIPQLILLR